MFRHSALEIGTQFANARLWFLRNSQISHQSLIGILSLPYLDDTLLHSGVLIQDSFYFSQFNSEPPNFHLLVCPPEKFDVSVRAIASKIARFV